MSDKPHTVAIGAFVLGAALITLAITLFLLGSGFGQREKIIMVFDGSVKGLNVGAPVALRGVQVGQVTSIKAILDSNTVDLVIAVEADFDPNAIHLIGEDSDELTEELLERGLRAQLNTQSLLTGLLYIQLDFFPGSELKLASINSPYFQFPTVPTDLERITRKLQDIDFAALIDDLTGLGGNLNGLLESEELNALPANVNETLQSLQSLSEELRQQMVSTGPKLNHMLDSTATTMNSASDELPQLAQLVEQNLAVLNEAVGAFEQTMGSVDGLVSHDSATIYRLNQALQEISRAGRALQKLASTLEEQPEALIRGKSGEQQ